MTIMNQQTGTDARPFGWRAIFWVNVPVGIAALIAAPAIDPFSGYRSYDASQVVTAQVIRRLRDLGMSLDSVRTVVGASDVETRNREIVAHLARMELQLEQTQAAVASLRALLGGPAAQPAVEFRKIPAVTALAVRQEVTAAGLMEWGSGAFEALSNALSANRASATGPFGALFPVRVLTIPAVEAAVAMHTGAPDDIDRTYGALGTAVADRAIGVDGPIREYYLVGFADPDDERRHRTEVCWPVFLTGVEKA